MIHTIKNGNLIIRKNKHFSKINLRNWHSLLEDPILEHLTFLEVVEIWKSLYGVPGNCKQYLKKICELYDKSENVNSFIYKDNKYWFDKNTRASLASLINCSKNNIQLVLGDELIELDLNKAKEFISDLELYASKCYINTKKHLTAIKELKTFEDLINYDYTKGYPEKIILNE